jgi:Ca2+-binding EF-hand superfamily protein
MAFNPQNYASAFITVEEVTEIKKAFDFFDRDLGGAIDPKGNSPPMQN